PLPDEVLQALFAEAVTAGRRPAVLPHDRVVERLAGALVPGDDRLTLVRDPDRGEVGRRRARRPQGLVRHGAGHLPDLGGVVLDPPGPGKVLRELAICARAQSRLAVEHEAGRAGRALVDREDHGREANAGGSAATDRPGQT